MTRDPIRLIPADFTPVPSLAQYDAVDVQVVDELDSSLDAIGILVHTEGDVPEVALDREALARVGFEAKAGQTLVLPQPTGPTLVAVGAGAADEQTDASLRDAAAAFVRAVPKQAALGIRVASLAGVDAETSARALTEGALLARYRFAALKATPKEVAIERLQLAAEGLEAGPAGVGAGIAAARAAAVARDLTNAPPAHLTAADLADVAVELAGRFDFEAEVFDKEALIELGCGGLLGVNAGSAFEPRMVKLTYTPEGESTGHLGLVGKGITYDSGGISLKPSDGMHALMKMDMGGAANVLATFTALRELGASATVTGWMMCTDNMPSGSATKLGDVLTARGGKTVEVKNTDAEGRLVMMDAIALAAEEGVDAIIDIATLTGAALMALGQSRAAVLGTSQPVVDALLEASGATDEPLWQLPLEKKYRKLLESDIADLSNIGANRYAGATTAALFLAEFAGDTPWAHLDIAGTMSVDSDESWRSKGATGFGTRTLVEVARTFTPPAE
ncbi:putative cytosol aminopeptidase [Agromyces rhizosphaerae]|uniref:Probable cytosol aminopeptidase n=1 Tax=Agromyces rhizosphaerae TaxID=88374 RepID=A0A9W6D0E3_9MICO|nr:leucyl aminopeptidase [Agromyces rhizosphaerae]GLI27173.1 putative cytosol aminopeptidase [Agromyces rhizosphaerae]